MVRSESVYKSDRDDRAIKAFEIILLEVQRKIQKPEVTTSEQINSDLCARIE